MKAKFLPFCSENASIETIKEKLWASGKGIPEYLLVGILKAVNGEGLRYVREQLTRQPEKPWLGAYEEFLEHNSQFNTSPSTVENLYILNDFILASDWEKELDTRKDLVISYVCNGFGGALNTLEFYKPDIGIAKIFSELGAPTYFRSKAELKVYVFYRRSINQSTTVLIHARYGDSGNET